MGFNLGLHDFEIKIAHCHGKENTYHHESLRDVFIDVKGNRGLISVSHSSEVRILGTSP